MYNALLNEDAYWERVRERLEYAPEEQETYTFRILFFIGEEWEPESEFLEIQAESKKEAFEMIEDKLIENKWFGYNPDTCLMDQIEEWPY